MRLASGRIEKEFERMFQEPEPARCFDHLETLLAFVEKEER